MNLNRPIILYMHAGSGNHGCEAIVNSTLRLIADERRKKGIDTHIPVVVVSNSVDEDRMYSLGRLEKYGLCILTEDRHIDRELIPHIVYYAYRKVSGDRESFQRFKYKSALRDYRRAVSDYLKTNTGYEFEGKPLAVSIGGDNYCYPEMVQDLILAHNVFIKNGFETVLWGCSIEPESLSSQELVEDLKAYDRIYARESISYNAMLEAGVSADKIELRKDPAFELETSKVPLPKGFLEGRTVGVNLSPMVQNKETVPGITLENYKNFIRYILDNTDQNVALIPHVVWASNDDRVPLEELALEFESTKRVVLIGDAPAEELKGYISRCSFFVGARTHSTIAAYSSNVPTLVIGYSVKSRGIATDLFGGYENYVLPVQDITEGDAMIKAYQWILSRGQMLIIKIAGGLGNQMQQYSLYRKLLHLGKEVKLDLSWFSPKIQEKMLAPREFELPLFEGIPYEVCTDEERDSFLKQCSLDMLTGKVLKKMGLRDNANQKVFTETKMFHPEIFELDDKYIEGYFACQKYYEDIEEELRQLFVFPEHSVKDLHQRNMILVSKIDKENSVSVHIRRGDYLAPENVKILGNIATEEYYASAMKYFEDKYPDVHFYIFTSDHEYARAKYSDESKFTIVDWNTGKDSVQDLMLMSHCKGNICANSTFSFWGARLNGREGREIIRTATMRNNQKCDPDIMHEYWKGWILMDKNGVIV